MSELAVRGGPTAEELAVVLAVLRPGAPPPAAEPYRRWRRIRLAALAGTSPPRPA